MRSFQYNPDGTWTRLPFKPANTHNRQGAVLLSGLSGLPLASVSSVTADCEAAKNESQVLIVRQDIRSTGGFFPTNSIGHNQNDPSANAYSIADSLEDYRRPDGSFKFKLCYPGNLARYYNVVQKLGTIFQKSKTAIISQGLLCRR